MAQTNEDINYKLHNILGLCGNFEHKFICDDCGEHHNPIDFFTWEGFGILWEWVIKHPQFVSIIHGNYKEFKSVWIDSNYINPLALSIAVVEFFK